MTLILEGENEKWELCLRRGGCVMGRFRAASSGGANKRCPANCLESWRH